ncbi:MAG TPA: DUF58 domain-containing protein [Gemmatimonadaceae bacterium]|nr:DUF58 domain-containing protein [Gemmatimonadaceae bacterium]
MSEAGIGERESGIGRRARGSRPGARVPVDSATQGSGSLPPIPDSQFPIPSSRPKTPVPPEVLRQVRLLELRTRGLVNSLFSGEYHSVFKGQGMEFAEVREYQPGDEVRSIDWNVTARMRQPFVKRYVEERELTVMLMVDLSGSSRFGTTSLFKSELATELSAVLAMSASRNNDRVGALLFTDRVEHVVPPGKGRKHILRLIRDIMAYEPAGSATNIGVATEYVGKMLNHRAIIFILSDFQSGDMERPIKLLVQRHDVVAVSLEDPRERTLPDIGLARFVDPETGETVDVDTSNAQVRAEYDQAVGEDIERRRRLFNRLGIDEIAVRTDTGYVDPLLRFFRLREQRGRRG